MKIVVVPVGQAARIEEINSMYNEGKKLLDDTDIGHTNLGNGLYLAAGDNSAVDGQPFNFEVTNGRSSENAFGTVLFVRRNTTSEGTEYESLSDHEAVTLFRMFEVTNGQRRIQLDTRYMYTRLGWEQ